jgi:hypothetical protein
VNGSRIPAVLPVVETFISYLREHPEELLRVLRNGLALRFGVPIAGLRWLAGRLKGKRAPKDIVIQAVPPGVRVGAELDLMGTAVRASAVVYVENLRIEPETVRIELRLAEVSLKLVDQSAESPIAALLKSGALDLSKPGNLAAYMPKRPALLVEAKDDRIVLDLMKHPKFAHDTRLKRALGLVVPLVTIGAIESDPEHLDVAFRPLPKGVSEVLRGVRRAVGR